MRSRSLPIERLRREWRWIAVICVALALPARFTVPLGPSIGSYLLGVLMIVASVAFFGRSYIVWDALPSFLVVAVVALVSQALHSFKLRDQEFEKMRRNMPGLRVPDANRAHALDGGTALQFHISHHWPATSDVIRSVKLVYA
jgi:hypothetical protein